MDQRSGFPRADRAGDARPIGRHWNLRPPGCPLSLAACFARAGRGVGRGREQDRGRAQDRHGARRNSQRRTPTPRWPVAGVRSGNKLKAGHGEPTEPGQRVIAVALVDVHHLIDLADDEDVGSLGVVDAAYKDRHGSPRVVGATIHNRSIDESQCAFECGPQLAEKKASLPRGDAMAGRPGAVLQPSPPPTLCAPARVSRYQLCLPYLSTNPRRTSAAIVRDGFRSSSNQTGTFLDLYRRVPASGNWTDALASRRSGSALTRLPISASRSMMSGDCP